jgi:hypothetical protein
VRLILRLYAFLLRLYPRRFRAEFEAEMQRVFTEAAAEAAVQKPWARRTCWDCRNPIEEYYVAE